MNPLQHDHAHESACLAATIQRLEARLAQLDGGDCAYEKALVRSYEQTVASAREQLAVLERR